MLCPRERRDEMSISKYQDKKKRAEMKNTMLKNVNTESQILSS